MTKILAIDPGSSKCGIVIADLEEKIVYEAVVLQSNLLFEYLQRKYLFEKDYRFLIGNGTSSEKIIKILKKFASNVIIVDEKNTTFRAKERYFELFPLIGIKSLLPREIFLLNKNLDALAALIILEDHYKCKFDLLEDNYFKTWQK